MKRPLAALLFAASVAWAEQPLPNTDKGDTHPPTPQESLARLQLPAGFEATVFAAEPDLRQPIGFTTDERGRLWVAENYTYSENPLGWHPDLKDRITVLADHDGDGRSDQRTVFYDRFDKLTSVEVGFGGIFALAPPNLYFIPDRNRDDVPDAAPQVVLDGFVVGRVRHNIANGLMWGPDGWLYGRHGIQDTSYVGRPGTTRDRRTALNCGIWRYHPVEGRFEVVAHGTTNPWGMDYDEHGEFFFTNTVIGHLWHLVPGAHYRRMYGADLIPNTYQFIDQCADHYHWDTGKAWHQTREVVGLTDKLGGGHAHVGCMIYQGDNWPPQYRGKLFTANLHGRRLNQEVLVRHGNGYVAKHGADVFQTGDPWFRGIEMRTAHDGGVYVSDWSDTGECHENDGVHRTSGRIYKITHGKPKASDGLDLGNLRDAELVALLEHDNAWFARHALRILHERAADQLDMGGAAQALVSLFKSAATERTKLRALWALDLCGKPDAGLLEEALKSDSEHLRVWALRLSTPEKYTLMRLAQNDPSGLVRLHIASLLQQVPAGDCIEIAVRLTLRREDAHDKMQPHMIWYGIEPALHDASARELWLKSFLGCKIPLVRQNTARWCAQEYRRHPQYVAQLLGYAIDSGAPELQLELLEGIAAGFRGQGKLEPPPNWSDASKVLPASQNPKIQKLVREIGIVFGDGRAADELLKIAASNNAELSARISAIETLAIAGEKKLIPILKRQLRDTAIGIDSITALGKFDPAEAGTTSTLVGNLKSMRSEHRQAAIGVLSLRAGSARALLDAVEKKLISASEISPYQARQIANLGDPGIADRLNRLWGIIGLTDKEKTKKIAAYEKQLTPAVLAKVDREAGHALFTQICAVCHKLRGEGGAIGPDLTGSGRENIHYLLENLIDPSAVVPADFRLSVIVMKDGRTLSGVLTPETADTKKLTTQEGAAIVASADIKKATQLDQSLMPEGLLEALSDQQVRDLIGFLSGK